jgi:hypothetical protein
MKDFEKRIAESSAKGTIKFEGHCLPFGKYAGRTIAEILDDDPHYLREILDDDRVAFCDQVLEKIEQRINDLEGYYFEREIIERYAHDFETYFYNLN